MGETMTGVYLPGDRAVRLASVPVPVPGPGQVLLRVGASTICGSDLRAIYREHLGAGPEAYQDVIAGHEPAGTVVEVGPQVRGLAVDDRVVVYHISGCGRCADCRLGYQISCTSPERAAYGWQRDGGHAEFLLAQARDCLPLPPSLSMVDGACVACGFGTAYEGLCRAAVSGADRLLVVGLGPVGQAVGLLGGRLGAPLRIGVDVSERRLAAALTLGAIDHAIAVDEAPAAIAELTGGAGCEVSVDCSGATAGRTLAIGGTARRGRVVLLGEGARLDVEASPLLLHRQLTVHGSWVTSTYRMAELLDRLARWRLHPEIVVTDRFDLVDAQSAYRLADTGDRGKIAIVPND